MNLQDKDIFVKEDEAILTIIRNKEFLLRGHNLLPSDVAVSNISSGEIVYTLQVVFEIKRDEALPFLVNLVDFLERGAKI